MGLDRETGRATWIGTLGLPGKTDLDDFSPGARVWNGYAQRQRESFGLPRALGASRPFAMWATSDSHRADRPPDRPAPSWPVADDAAPSWSRLSEPSRPARVTVAAGVFVTAELAGPRRATRCRCAS
ncbi:MAG: hypothetical protein M5U28_05640 [Sandaracinaceae bacterium]|nr:hypothetical protein [Sandaracinaceae bacterium]